MSTTVHSHSPHTIPTSNDEIGYHQNWYPVATSDEISASNVAGKDFLGGRVIVYRDQAGKAVVQSAYCRHLGADLSLGEIVDSCIKCPFHHWQYNSEGMCVKIPAGDKIPPAAQLFTFPSAEFLGLIWAFNGEKPLYDVPSFPDVETSSLAYAVEVVDTYPFPIEPWLLITNSCDFQHLIYLHELEMRMPDEVVFDKHGISYETLGEIPGTGLTKQHIRVIGTNVFTLTVNVNGIDVYSMSANGFNTQTGTTSYNICAIRDTHPQTEQEQAIQQAILQQGLAFTKSLVEDDGPVLKTMRFREGLLVASDRYLSRYFKYVRQFSRANPVQPYL